MLLSLFLRINSSGNTYHRIAGFNTVLGNHLARTLSHLREQTRKLWEWSENPSLARQIINSSVTTEMKSGGERLGKTPDIRP